MVSTNACHTPTCNESGNDRSSRYFVPAVDIVETPEAVVLKADMPGATTDQIDVRYEDGELTVHAPVAARRKDDGKFLMEEYAVGDYRRSFRLGRLIDSTKIGANYSDGVLTLTLPKVEAARPRKIAVNA